MPGVEEGGIKIMVADPQPLIGEAIAGALASIGTLEVAETRPSSGLDAVDAVVEAAPDVAVADYWMPDMEGCAVTRLIRARRPNQKVVLISWFYGPREVQESLNAGAVGFMPKSASIADLEGAIRSAHEGATLLPAEVQAVLGEPFKSVQESSEVWSRLVHLSRRQIEVIHLIGMDLRLPEIGRRLGISPQTVKVHLKNILAKTEAATQKEVVAMARSAGLIRD